MPSSRPTSTPIPWLSVLLLAACVAFSVHARVRGERVMRDGNAALEAARDYYLSHPYLEPGVALETHFDGAALRRARTEYEQREAAQGSIPTPPGVIRRQQGELDQRVEKAVAHAGALPAAHIAFAPGRSAAPTWLGYVLLHRGNAVLFGNGLLLLFFGLYLERSLGRAFYAAVVAWLVLAGAVGWSIAAPRDAVHGLVGTTPLLAGLAAVFAARFASRYHEGFFSAGLLASALWLLLPPHATLNWSFAPLEFAAVLAPPPAATSVYLPCLAAVIASALASALAWGIGIGAGDARDAAGEVRDPRLRRAFRARDAKRPREALELLNEYLADQPDAYEAAVAAHELARELGRDADVTSAALRVIRIELRRGLAAAALDHWLDLVRGGIPERTEAALLIHVALLLREFDHKAEAVRALRFALENSEERENHVIAMRIARAARGLDPGTSETAAWRALASVELSLKDRQALESLIAEGLTTPAERAASYQRIEDRNAPRLAASAPVPAAAAPAPSEPESSPEHPRRPAAIEIETRDVRVLDAVLAVPVELGVDGIEIQTSQGQKKLVRYERIEALSVAAVQGIATKPVIVVDLVLNWKTARNDTLRVIRLRGDQFDPRRLVAEQSSPIDALRAFVKKLLERSAAIPLPDPEAAVGRPFASFDELVIYQRAVLLVEAPAARA